MNGSMNLQKHEFVKYFTYHCSRVKTMEIDFGLHHVVGWICVNYANINNVTTEDSVL